MSTIPKLKIQEELWFPLRGKSFPNVTSALTSEQGTSNKDGVDVFYYILLVLMLYALCVIFLIIKFSPRKNQQKPLDVEILYDKYVSRSNNQPTEFIELTRVISCPQITTAEYTGDIVRTTNSTDEQLGSCIHVKVKNLKLDHEETTTVSNLSPRSKSLPEHLAESVT